MLETAQQNAPPPAGNSHAEVAHRAYYVFSDWSLGDPPALALSRRSS
jgi:hypothetical protein